MANATSSTLLALAWNTLGIDGSGVTQPGLQTTTMLAKLSEANAEYLLASKTGGGEPPKTVERETQITLVADTALAEDITTATTDFDVDSASDLDSSGALVLWTNSVPDTVEYNPKSSNNLAGVTGIGASHETDDAVQKLYALPSNFGSFRATEDSESGVMVNGVAYRFTSGIPEGNRFNYYDNGTTKFLWFPRGLTGTVGIFYNKVGTTLDELTDTVDVPPEYQWFLVYRLVEHGHRCLGSNADKIAEAMAQANEILLRYLKQKNIGKRPLIRPMMQPVTEFIPYELR